MGHLKDLAQDEVNELLHSRLATVEAFLCAAYDGFCSDVVAYLEKEVGESTLTAAQKAKISAKMLQIKAKYPERTKR